MTRSPEELLALKIGERTVGENLKRAVEAGKLIEDADGSLRFAKVGQRSANWAMVPNGPPLDCLFLMYFAFRHAYARSAVPQGCSACYKVSVAPRTLRQLVAAWGIAKRIECRSKWGVDLNNRLSQNIYAGYFFTDGLDMARMIFRIAREAIDNDPILGSDIPMSIKRGCSEYEAALGPSDRYEFMPELAELEEYLKTRFRVCKPPGLPPVPLVHWIDTAFRVGDDTYLDFTGGKRLRPAPVSYDP